MQKTFVTAAQFSLFSGEERDLYFCKATDFFLVRAVIYVSEVG